MCVFDVGSCSSIFCPNVSQKKKSPQLFIIRVRAREKRLCVLNAVESDLSETHIPEDEIHTHAQPDAVIFIMTCMFLLAWRMLPFICTETNNFNLINR